MTTPTGEQLATKGVLLAVADGVGGNAGGREAAEMTVRGVLSDYYATPETLGVAHRAGQGADGAQPLGDLAGEQPSCDVRHGDHAVAAGAARQALHARRMSATAASTCCAMAS